MRRIRGYQAATIGRNHRIKFQATSVKPLVSGPRRARNRKKDDK
jgi:hypothetical protein